MHSHEEITPTFRWDQQRSLVEILLQRIWWIRSGWINVNGKRSPIKWWKGRPNGNKFVVEQVGWFFTLAGTIIIHQRFSTSTRVKIEKINNLFQVDINRREQGCAANYEQYCRQHVVTALFNCNNLEQHGWQLVHSWPRNNVYACRYQLGTTCAFLAV
jgi:hypothetical protein